MRAPNPPCRRPTPDGYLFSGADAGSGGVGAATIPLPSGVRVWLATGHTDIRKGFASLSLQVQVLRRDPLSGQISQALPAVRPTRLVDSQI